MHTGKVKMINAQEVLHTLMQYVMVQKLAVLSVGEGEAVVEWLSSWPVEQEVRG